MLGAPIDVSRGGKEKSPQLSQPLSSRKGKEKGEEGQALLEWILVFPLLTLLLLFVGLFAWWWWEQTTAAWAIHDGVHVAARQGGSVGAGLSVVDQELSSALGGYASRFSGHVSIFHDPARRSVRGEIDLPQNIDVPFVGPVLFRVRASSFQRDERFYGGPPSGWW